MSHRRWLAVSLLAGCSAPTEILPDAQPAWPAEPAPEWNALLARGRGWTGADGVFSVALDGRDALASADAGSRSLLWFSDSMIGAVGEDGAYAKGVRMINNSVALLTGAEPSAEHICFLWSLDEEGEPSAVFLPRTRDSRADEWYWLGDGFARDDEVVIFGMRMTRRGTGGVFNFIQRGHTLIRARVDAEGGLAELDQLDLLLWSPGDGERTDLALGSGLLLHDARSGAERPDGFLYVYGTWNRGYDKELVAARIRPEAVKDPAAWRFWDGARWSSDLADLAPICGGVSSELSVTPVPNGRYVLVFLEGGMGEWVSIRLGASPIGPFGPPHRIWRCPEVAEHEQVFAYNAKAHPHLSASGELLVSYNLNSLDFFGELLLDATIYRPRFVRLPLDWLSGRE